jgi:hypothetical protein
MTLFKRALEPYLVEPQEAEKFIYQHLRIRPQAVSA